MPIKERILNELKKGPVRYKKLQAKFKAGKKFFAAMEELYSRGLIAEKGGYISLAEKTVRKKDKKNDGRLAGVVVKLTENFGFVRCEGLDEDIFVSGKNMMGAVTGDEVLVQTVKAARRDMEGIITRITKEKTNIVGTALQKGRRMYVQLKDCPYVCPKAENPIARDGDIVLVNLSGRGYSHRRLTAQIQSVIGVVSDSKKAVDVLLAEKNVSRQYPRQAVDAAVKRIEEVDFDRERKNRKDLTDLPIFTIDSAYTKDIDDAIYVAETENGYDLSVHIADVSFYVQPSDRCDMAAFERGTSIYFGESVIPMLPAEYSNDVCSLNENRTRFAFTCQMSLDKQGNVKKYEFFKSVIRSRVKGVYSEVNALLAGDADREIKEKYSQVSRRIFTAAKLYEKLRDKRVARGSMDIESDEAYILFGPDGKAVDIQKRERGLAEMIIEEFMLLANSCSANLAKKIGLPFVYRIHRRPDSEKLDGLKENLAKLGLSMQRQPGESMQQTMSRLLDDTRGTNLQTVVHKLILRSQSKAKYSEQPIGHFGLGLEDYAHFTSPIRRYPDLAIHRILSYWLQTQDRQKTQKRFAKFAKRRSERSSAAELAAMQVERGANDIYKAEIMQGHIGESYAGVVSSVTSFGIYVALENTVEGLVHVSKLDMVSPQLDEGYCLYCPISGKKYTLGQPVQVVVEGVDILNGNVDFALEGWKTAPTDKKTDKKVRENRGKKRSGAKRTRQTFEKKAAKVRYPRGKSGKKHAEK